MSGAGAYHGLPWRLSIRGRLVVAERLIRFGQALSPNAFKALMFIYDRTLAWDGRCDGVIPASHFLCGVPGARGTLAAHPIGLTEDELSTAIDELIDVGAIRRSGSPHPITYEINITWSLEGFMPKWMVQESDYIYPASED